MSCPWDWLGSRAGAFCEAPLCAWVREPGNAWSSLAFVAVGVALLARTAAPERRHLRGVAWISLVTGVGSFAYHATDTRFGAAFDYAGIFLGGAYMLLVCFLRWTGASRRAAAAVFWALAAAGLGVFLWREDASRIAYAAEGAACVLSEIGLFFTPRRAPSYRWFWAAWAAFVPAMILWTLDVRGTLCDPSNHLVSGHAAWHLLGAVAFWLSYRYYLQFETLKVLAPRGSRTSAPDRSPPGHRSSGR